MNTLIYRAQTKRTHSTILIIEWGLLTHRIISLMGDIEGCKISSIDVLEESLNSIHRCRRNSLLQKIKRREHGCGTNRSHDALRYTVDTSTRMPVKARVDNRKYIDSTALPQDSFEEILLQKPPPLGLDADTAREKGKYNKRNESYVAATSLDIKAEEALLSLRNEITAWCAKHPDRITDEDSRGEFADYLTDKYMCNVLDPMPSSTTISRVRKQLSMDLESFVTAGPGGVMSSVTAEKESADTTSQPVTTPQPASVDKKIDSRERNGERYRDGSDATTGKQAGVKLNVHSSISGKQIRPQDTTLKRIEEKKLMEKEKIKNQYEKFRQLKAESEKSASSANVRQAEANVDDIQSLLTALQSKK